MAHYFSVVDNFDGKFVKEIIELPFTGEFVTDGWLPTILVNLPGSHEQLKKSVNFALRIVHFAVVCLVAWPLSGSGAGVGLVLMKTLMLFTCKSCFYHAN